MACGKAYGNAAMLLASGKKGNRYAMPHASIMMCPPKINRKVDTATNVMIAANDLDANTDTYVEYLAQFTGKSKEVVMKDIERTFYFTPTTAVEYGLIDKARQGVAGLGSPVASGARGGEQAAAASAPGP